MMTAMCYLYFYEFYLFCVLLFFVFVFFCNYSVHLIALTQPQTKLPVGETVKMSFTPSAVVFGIGYLFRK